MDLTPQEQRALRILERRGHDWRWLRFIALLLGLGMLATCLWAIPNLTRDLIELTHNMTLKDRPTAAEAFIASLDGALLMIFITLVAPMAACIIGLTVARWRGRPVDVLVRGIVSRMQTGGTAPSPRSTVA